MIHDEGKKLSTWLKIWLLLAVGTGLAFRIVSMWQGKVNADEAIVGLMGMEILEGHHFIFYWGQAYMGSLEAYAAALLFALLGISVVALKAAPFLFFLAAALCHFFFTRKLIGKRAAALSLGLLFLSPAGFTIWTISPRGGYMEVIALGTAALLLGLFIGRGREKTSAALYFLLGLLCGLGFWTHYLFIYYFLVLAAFVILPGLIISRWKNGVIPLGAGFLAGFWPAILYNIHNEFASREVLERAADIGRAGDAFNLFLLQMPRLLGAIRTSGTSEPLWMPLSVAVLVIYSVAVLYALPALIQRGFRKGAVPHRLLFMPIALCLTILFFFIGTAYGAANTLRYILPIYPMLLFMLALLISDIMDRRKWAAWLILIIVSVSNSLSTGYFLYRLYLPESRVFMGEMAGIIGHCREKGITAAYGDYWHSFPLTLLSRKELIVASVGERSYEPYDLFVADSPDPSIIFEGRSREIRSTLAAIGYDFDEVRVGGVTIFDGPRLPEEIGPAGRWRKALIAGTDGGAFEAMPGGGVVSRGHQQKGMSVSFGLPAPTMVNGLMLHSGEGVLYYPQAFIVEASADGEAWVRIREVERYLGNIYHVDRLVYGTDGVVTLYFPPREVVLFRVTILEDFPGRKWAVSGARFSALTAGK